MKRFFFLFLLVLLACTITQTEELAQSTVEGPAYSPEVPVPTHEFIWHPTSGTTFQWQLTDLPLDLSVDAEVYDIDLFDNDASVVAALHAAGRKVVCYISVGSWEDWRPDADQFPSEVLGEDYEGWPGEKWLDIRQIDALAPILRLRLDLCAARGFDGVEPDNMEVLGNETGFPITYADQLAFAIWLANEAHARGLAIGLKNAPDMAADVQPYFDFAITEDCFYYGWCGQMTPFLEAGKPVFAVEYTDMDIDFEAACAEARALGLTMVLKDRDLGADRQTCP
jgi:hypothetical protein